jgi:hypothetical protein
MTYFARSDFARSFYHDYFAHLLPFIILNRYFILRSATTEADKEEGSQAEKRVASPNILKQATFMRLCCDPRSQHCNAVPLCRYTQEQDQSRHDMKFD